MLLSVAVCASMCLCVWLCGCLWLCRTTEIVRMQNEEQCNSEVHAHAEGGEFWDKKGCRPRTAQKMFLLAHFLVSTMLCLCDVRLSAKTLIPQLTYQPPHNLWVMHRIGATRGRSRPLLVRTLHCLLLPENPPSSPPFVRVVGCIWAALQLQRILMAGQSKAGQGCAGQETNTRTWAMGGDGG